MSSLADLRARAAELGGILTALAEEFGSANVALSEARSDAARAKAHERVEAASKAEARAERELQQIQQQIEVAVVAAASAELAERWKNFESEGTNFQIESERLQDLLVEFNAQFLRTLKAGEQARQALPAGALATAEFSGMLWVPSALTKQVKLELFKLSDGRFNAGEISMSPWELAQGPDLKAKVRENIARLLARRPAPQKPKRAA